MILVTGATGNFGRAAIKFLLEKIPANTIAGLARNISKAEDLKEKNIDIRYGDCNDALSLKNTFTGIDKILLVSSNDIPHRTTQHINVIAAAKASGVKHIVYTSFYNNPKRTTPLTMVEQSHIDTENYLTASGLEYTIMRNTMYADALPAILGKDVLKKGITMSAGKGDGKATFATRNDMAEAAAVLLTVPGHENKSYAITSNESYSFTDMANILSEISGKEVRYNYISTGEYIENLVKSGMPEMYANYFVDFSRSVENGELQFESTDLEKLLRRKPTTMKEYLKSVYPS